MRALLPTLCLMAALSVGGCGSSALQLDGRGQAGAAFSPILNGQAPTSVDPFPWLVSLQQAQVSEPLEAHFCGGAIVNAHWVLTAAHCMSGPVLADPSLLRVVVGAQVLSDGLAQGQVRIAQAIHVFPGYTAVEDGRDVALVRVEPPFAFNDTVSPIRPAVGLDERIGSLAPGVWAEVAGWGRTFTAQKSDLLQYVTVPLVARDTAEALYQRPFGEDQLPAGDLSLVGLETENACHGDSGGPLVVNSKERACLASCERNACALVEPHSVVGEEPGAADAGSSGSSEPARGQTCVDFDTCVASCGEEKVVAGLVSWGEHCGRFGKPNLFAKPSASLFSAWIESLSQDQLPPYVSPGPIENATQSGAYGEENEWVYFESDLPPRAPLDIKATGGTGDVRLVVRRLEQGFYKLQCQSHTTPLPGEPDLEQCLLAEDTGGLYRLGIKGVSSFEDFSMSVHYSQPPLLGLSNGQVTPVGGDLGWFMLFPVAIPPNTQVFTATLSPLVWSTGNADLYVRRGLPPLQQPGGQVLADWASTGTGNSESIVWNQPKAGTYFIGVKATSRFRRVELKASYQLVK